MATKNGFLFRTEGSRKGRRGKGPSLTNPERSASSCRSCLAPTLAAAAAAGTATDRGREGGQVLGAPRVLRASLSASFRGEELAKRRREQTARPPRPLALFAWAAALAGCCWFVAFTTAAAAAADGEGSVGGPFPRKTAALRRWPIRPIRRRRKDPRRPAPAARPTLARLLLLSPSSGPL